MATWKTFMDGVEFPSDPTLPSRRWFTGYSHLAKRVGHGGLAHPATTSSHPVEVGVLATYLLPTYGVSYWELSHPHDHFIFSAGRLQGWGVPCDPPTGWGIPHNPLNAREEGLRGTFPSLWTNVFRPLGWVKGDFPTPARWGSPMNHLDPQKCGWVFGKPTTTHVGVSFSQSST